MPSKKKGDPVPKLNYGGGGAEGPENPEDKEAQLQKEYDGLTDTLNNLKRTVEKLRRENEFLLHEANQTRMESQEHMSYMSKRTQKWQTAIVSLSDQNHQELEALKKQREETMAKYQDKANELRKEILKRENELALLNSEIAELREFKTLQQQQLARIAELEKEVTSMHCRHSETLQGLKASFLSEKERYTGQAKYRVQTLALAANREASRCLSSHTREVAEENQHLRAELQQLIRKAGALRAHQEKLEAQSQQLLREKEYVKELRRIRKGAQYHPETAGGSREQEKLKKGTAKGV